MIKILSQDKHTIEKFDRVTIKHADRKEYKKGIEKYIEKLMENPKYLREEAMSKGKREYAEKNKDKRYCYNILNMGEYETKEKAEEVLADITKHISCNSTKVYNMPCDNNSIVDIKKNSCCNNYENIKTIIKKSLKEKCDYKVENIISIITSYNKRTFSKYNQLEIMDITKEMIIYYDNKEWPRNIDWFNENEANTDFIIEYTINHYGKKGLLLNSTKENSKESFATDNENQLDDFINEMTVKIESDSSTLYTAVSDGENICVLDDDTEVERYHDFHFIELIKID